MSFIGAQARIHTSLSDFLNQTGNSRFVFKNIDNIDKIFFEKVIPVNFGWFSYFNLVDGVKVQSVEKDTPSSIIYRVKIEINGPLSWLVDFIYGKFIKEQLTHEAQALKMDMIANKMS